MLYVLSEALLYCCYAILTGASVLALLPDNKKPRYHISDNTMACILLGVVLLSLVQVIKIIVFYKEILGYDIPYLLFTVLSDYKIGNAWFVTVITAMAMLFFIGLKPNSKAIKYKWKALPVLTLILLIAFGYASHSASLYGWTGFAAHTTHFVSAMVWIGVLFVVGWFTVELKNWAPFLKWFTPMAIVCVSLNIIAGFLLMSRLSPYYVSSWVTSFGQAMLIKHLLIVPIISLAIINTFLLRKEKNKTLTWIRAESIVIILLLVVTAFMGQQEPPHGDLKTILDDGPPLPWFTYISGYEASRGEDMEIIPNVVSMCFAAAGVIVMIGGLFWTLRKRKPLWSITAALFFVICGYLALMFSIA
ncbi:copper resistance D family protein [Paenibacillus alginolyticus]|uniref:CopD family protein n=1 Tax=Paenibacillus alginolyticus TaxID=59839 RepID=A0ABT4GJG1_9BACL|nr:CopD family protein [Paenibacillus alginolyticus]MCY9696168.1 CopD family protein [Paenibacillus alginolyticus]MEC0143321.1 CopD family protein [Paenibacillus alginolyticus]